MAEDFSGLRGFAQVVPVTQNQGNLYSLARLAQQKDLADRDFQQKQKDSAVKAYSEAASGLYVAKNLDPILQEAQKDSLMSTYNAMTQINKTAAMTGNYSNAGTSIIDAKRNHDTFAQGLESIGTAAKTIQDQLLADKTDQYNRETVGSALRDLETKALIRDGQGKVTGINYEEAAKISKLFDNPEAYNDATLAKNFVGKLGEISVAQQEENSSAYFTKGQTFTNGLYETNADGSPKVDANYGKPIPKATPEAVALWDGERGSIESKKLDSWAKSITPEGKNWEDYRGEAFKKFVVNQFGKYKAEPTKINEKSGEVAKRADQQALEVERYDNVRKLVFSPGKDSEALLSQSFDPSGRIRAKYVYEGGEQGSGKVIAIQIDRREPTTEENAVGKTTRTGLSDWQKFETIPIGTEGDKEAALPKINAIFNSADPAKSNVSGDRFMQIHKSKKPIDVGFK